MRGSKQDMAVTSEFDIPHGHVVMQQASWGAMNVALEQAPAGLDTAPFFKGLPDDLCPCPHWGYVIKGAMRVRYKDREEVLRAGDAYYLEPGHSILIEEGAEIVEFSPQGEYQKTMDHAARNMAGA